jgi:hypothetical protein
MIAHAMKTFPQPFSWFLLAGLIAIAPLQAQEAAAPPKKQSAADPTQPRRKNGGPPQKMVPYIGVLTRPVSPELRAQFQLQEGFGLVIEEILPDSPAAKAELKKHDILLKFEDQKLVNQEQLQTLIRSRKKDESIALTIISNGQTVTRTITVGELQTLARLHEPGPGRWPHIQPPGPPWQKLREQWEKHRRQSRDAHREGWDQRRALGATTEHQDHHQQKISRITRSDDSGIYTLHQENGATHFTAKPKDGEEQSWNLDKPEERRSIPAPLLEKLRLLEELR